MPKLISSSPLDEADSILGEQFYGRKVAAPVRTQPAVADKPRPTHYKIVCISLYTEDIERL
jgi:hypothetical protein